MSTFKEKAVSFLMSRIGKTAHVNYTTYITDHLLAISVYLPDGMVWRSCQHMKCATGKHAFRDYTIASWDVTTQTATLLIDVAHEGTGSNWARALQPEQTFSYGIGGGFHQPTAADNLVCIGDASAIAHFVSLYNRRNAGQHFDTLIIGKPLPATVLDMPVTPADTLAQLPAWLKGLDLKETTFYVAGNIPLVVESRKMLKQLGWKQIKSSGFWE